MMFKANVVSVSITPLPSYLIIFPSFIVQPQTVAGFEIDPGNFHEKNEICDVCGCFLIIGDTQARMDAHLMGKQHMGFARIRSKIVELKVSSLNRTQALSIGHNVSVCLQIFVSSVLIGWYMCHVTRYFIVSPQRLGHP